MCKPGGVTSSRPANITPLPDTSAFPRRAKVHSLQDAPQTPAHLVLSWDLLSATVGWTWGPASSRWTTQEWWDVTAKIR